MRYSKVDNGFRYEEVGLADLSKLAQELLDKMQHPVNVCDAPMGSGKTTLINALISAWGSPAAGSSPTFALIEEYEGPKGTFYHLDAYRLEDEEEAYDIGLDEYLEDGVPMWIEWGGKIRSLLPERLGWLTVELGATLQTRTVVFLPSVPLNEIQFIHE